MLLISSFRRKLPSSRLQEKCRPRFRRANMPTFHKNRGLVHTFILPHYHVLPTLPMNRSFSMLLKVAVMLGLIVALNGPQFSYLALRVLYGKRWAEAEGASVALGESSFFSLIYFYFFFTAHATECIPFLSACNIPGSQYVQEDLRLW